MSYHLRTVLIVLAIVPPLVGYTYYLATGWFARYFPEIDEYTIPFAGSSRYSISPDGAVSDDSQTSTPDES